MSEKKWGDTVLGWFVVKEGGSAAPAAPSPEPGILSDADIEAITKRSLGDRPVARPAPPPAGPQPPAFKGPPPPPAPGGQVDYDRVFEAAGIDAEERDRFKKAADLFRNLPEGTDPVVKKQIVEASLKAFGIPIDKIIEAGVEQVQALEGYQRSGAADCAKVCDEAEKRIRDLEEEIKRIRQVMQESVASQQAVVRATNDRKLEIQKVLEFFGMEAVARVVKESAKLVDPKDPPPAAPAPPRKR